MILKSFLGFGLCALVAAAVSGCVVDTGDEEPVEEGIEMPSEDVEPANHNFPPAGETNCSCFYQWECGADDRMYKMECCTCTGGFGCSGHWERTNYPC